MRESRLACIKSEKVGKPERIYLLGGLRKRADRDENNQSISTPGKATSRQQIYTDAVHARQRRDER